MASEFSFQAQLPSSACVQKLSTDTSCSTYVTGRTDEEVTHLSSYLTLGNAHRGAAR